jgi:hypothetical protein
MVNTSGQPGAVLPAELQGWNWGGFLLGWIWSIGHSAWLGFVLCFFLGIIGSIVQGVKGNEGPGRTVAGRASSSLRTPSGYGRSGAW